MSANRENGGNNELTIKIKVVLLLVVPRLRYMSIK